MKIPINIKSDFGKLKTKFYLFVSALLLVSAGLTSCNGNTNGGETTASHDTSSAISNRVDTIGGGSKQP